MYGLGLWTTYVTFPPSVMEPHWTLYRWFTHKLF